jgi:hypothetical protein
MSDHALAISRQHKEGRTIYGQLFRGCRPAISRLEPAVGRRRQYGRTRKRVKKIEVTGSPRPKRCNECSPQNDVDASFWRFQLLMIALSNCRLLDVFVRRESRHVATQDSSGWYDTVSGPGSGGQKGRINIPTWTADCVWNLGTFKTVCSCTSSEHWNS